VTAPKTTHGPPPKAFLRVDLHVCCAGGLIILSRQLQTPGVQPSQVNVHYIHAIFPKENDFQYEE
jgi:hypothetical protein